METEEKYYSQKAITIATFFGGPLAAGYLIKQNFLNLGKEDQAKNAFLIGLLSTIFIFSGIIAIPEHISDKIPNALIPAVYTGIIYLIVNRIQGNELDEHKEKGGEFYSGWKATGIGAVCMVIILAVIMLVAFIAGDLSNNTGNFDAQAYDVEAAQFADNEAKALVVFNVIESANQDYLIKEFQKGKVLWKENLNIIKKLQTYEDIPLELIERNKRLIKYCELRLEHTDLIIKAISEDTERYVPEIEKTTAKIQTILDEFHQ